MYNLIFLGFDLVLILYKSREINKYLFLNFTETLEDFQIFVARKSNFLESYNYTKNTIKVLPWKPFLKYDEVFKIAYWNYPPFVIENDNQEAIDGLDYRLVNEILKTVPHIFLHTPPNYNDNIWKIMLEKVNSGEADATVGSVYQTAAMLYNLSPSHPYGQTCDGFLVPKPHLLPKYSYVLQPLQFYLWAFYLVIIIILSTLIIIISRIITPKWFKYKIKNMFDFYILILIRIVSLDDRRLLPIKLQWIFKYFVFIWGTTVLILCTCYSAGFASIMTKPRYTTPINTFQDMVDQNIFWGSPNKDMKAYVKASTSPALKLLAENFITEDQCFRRNERIKSNNYAVLVHILPNKYITNTEDLDEYGQKHMKLLKDCVKLQQLVVGIKKHSPFVEYFRRKIMALSEFGIIGHWYDEIRMKYSLVFDSFYSTYSDSLPPLSPLKMIDIQGGFYVFFVGLGISCVVFICELIVHKYW